MSDKETKQVGIELDFGTTLKTLSGKTMQEPEELEEGKRYLREEDVRYRPLTIGSYLSQLLWSTAREKSGNVDQAELSLRIKRYEILKKSLILKDEERVLVRDLIDKAQQLSPGIKRQLLFFLDGKDPFEIND